MRTAGVRLTAEVGDYVRGVGKAERATDNFKGELIEAAAAGEAAGRATDELGDEFAEAARAASKLDREIGDLTRSLRALAVQQALTGDKSLSKSMREQETALRKLSKLRKTIGGDGDDAGRDWYAGLVGRLGPLVGRMPLGPWMLPAAVAAGPVIAGAIGAAISGGVAVGGIGAGLAIAGRDPKVKALAAALGEDIGQVFAASAQPFTPVAIDTLNKVRASIRAMKPDFDAIFGAGAGRTGALVDSLLAGAESLVHSLRKISDTAQPVVDVIGEHLGAALSTTGDAMENMASHTQYAADTLDGLLVAAEGAVAGTSKMVELLGWLGDKGFGGFTALTALGLATDNAGTKARFTAGELRALREAAESGADRIKRLKDAFDELFDSQMSLDRATDRFKEGMRDLNEELMHGRRSLSQNTAEGLRNRNAVLDQIEKIKALRDARIRHGMSLDAANAKYQADIAGLRRAAIAAGFNRAQVDALVGAYRRIPDRVNTKVGVTGIGPSVGELARLRRYIASVPRYVAIHARVTTTGDVRVPGGTIQRRWGGITEHAQSGLIREPAIYTPMEPARYAFAEPATGGEAFIPKHGDYARSLGILDRAAGWYGHSLVPGRGRGGGTTVVNMNLTNAGVIGSRMELENWLTRAFNKLAIGGRT